ncbi:MAG: threonylcarbamoyl-AMP synthase [Flavobacteriales bacterium]|nr:MAG: threonylcarbamoyl-AMP synthase [Flavobacteriales bacterium]
MDELENEIKKAVEVLLSGGTIIYPTETVWGMGCDATNEDAISKIFKIKNRAQSNSLVALVSSENMLNQYININNLNDWELNIYNDKILTIIFPCATGLSKNILAEDKSAAIRITTDVFCKKLIKKFGKPIVSTSANLSGEQPAKSLASINPAILGKVDYVVNLPERIGSGKPSTIVKLLPQGKIKVIRE